MAIHTGSALALRPQTSHNPNDSLHPSPPTSAAVSATALIPSHGSNGRSMPWSTRLADLSQHRRRNGPKMALVDMGKNAAIDGEPSELAAGQHETRKKGLENMRCMFRRASHSVKLRSDHGPSKTRRLNSSFDGSHHPPMAFNGFPCQHDQGQHDSAQEQTQDDDHIPGREVALAIHPPRQSSGLASALKRAASFRRERRPATSGPSGQAALHYTIHNHHALSIQIAPGSEAIPVHIDPNTGSAARAAAAAQNEKNNTLTRLLSGVRERSPRALNAVTRDSESAVFMDSPMEDVTVTPPVFKDPLKHLPTELSAIILSFLDAQSLARAECVSKAWNSEASSSHVWREVFLRRYQQKIHVQPPPLQMGGVGASTIRPGRDWKRLYHTRKTIEGRWSSGQPAAVYFSGHTDSVYCCQFDEDKIITGSRDRTIRVWDMHTYKCLKVIGGPDTKPVPPSSAAELETHPAATISAAPSLNGTPEGDALFHVPSDYHSASILCLQFDDEIMVTGSSDSTCIVWDLATFQPRHRLLRHSAGVLDVCFDAHYIVSCSKDATICVWHRRTGALLRQLTGHRGPVNAVQLRGNLLVSASGDGVAKLWNLDSGACVKEFASRDRGLAAVEFSDDAATVLAGGNDQVVYRFDARTSELGHTYEGHAGLVRSLFLDSPNARVLSGSYDQSMRVYDFKSGREVATYKDWTTSWILAAKCDYRRIVATSQDGRALLMDFGHGVEGVEELRGEGF